MSIRVWLTTSLCASALLGFALSVPLSAPAYADDADIKKAAPQMRATFIEAFNKQDVATLAATYTSDAVTVNPTGVQEINAKVIEGWFANGPRTIDTTFDQALPLSADIALGIGTFRVTGKTLKGEPVEVTARWANTYVRQDGRWKIRMATTIPPPLRQSRPSLGKATFGRPFCFRPRSLRWRGSQRRGRLFRTHRNAFRRSTGADNAPDGACCTDLCFSPRHPSRTRKLPPALLLGTGPTGTCIPSRLSRRISVDPANGRGPHPRCVMTQ